MLHLQTFLGVMVAAGLILAAAFAERRHAEERLRLVVESAPNAMLMAASDGRIVLVNAQAEKLFGYQREELIGQAVEMLLPEQYRARHPGYRGGFAADPQARPMGAGRDLHGRRKDGGEVPIEIGLNPIKTAEGLLILASIVDITERKRIEAAQAKLAAIVESSDDAIIGMTIEGIVETWNCGAERIFGYAAEEIVGKSISILIPEERASEEKEILDRLRRGNRLENFETVRIAKDGRRLDVSLTISPIKGSTGRIIGASKIARDISPRKRAEKELLRAKADAEEANSAKDRFLAVLSHELRTPLTPVLMGVSTLQEVRELAPDVREILEMVRRNVELETRLIDDLLDVTRIARGKVELTRSPAPLRTIIQRAIEVCMPDMEAGGLHFGVDLGTAEACWVMADAPRLQQVFWNLLKNAIKFTRHGGCVGVRCRRDRSHVVAEVNDSGIGIDPEALPRVFDAFEQSERSITRQFGGMGLGLTICKALVEMHGGTIEAHSEGRGKGTTFRVRLPLSAPAGQPDAPDASAPRERDVCPLRILLVEDHEIAAKMIGMALTLEGHELETAGNVAMALELADRRAFDLLISDIGLPDGSGLDLMRQLRQRGHNLPGIALSGYGQEEDIQRSQEAGFATHIIKPAARKRLIEAIASVTAGHGATDG
jgi:two-component system CheB/CheR fusion protein